jgi:hypothetical protein
LARYVSIGLTDFAQWQIHRKAKIKDLVQLLSPHHCSPDFCFGCEEDLDLKANGPSILNVKSLSSTLSHLFMIKQLQRATDLTHRLQHLA